LKQWRAGTPVIAYAQGSVPEVLGQGLTDFVVRNLDDAVDAARRSHELSRARCREVFEQRFTAQHMAHAYFDVYEQLRSD
jgi:glycosyltransferase involved in cell wall biosynthesis